MEESKGLLYLVGNGKALLTVFSSTERYVPVEGIEEIPRCVARLTGLCSRPLWRA